MKFLVDESVEYRVVIFLRNLGYDTRSVVESFSGLDDKIILSVAYKENRILITNDKDFGELIYRLQLPHQGIILFRLSKETYQSKEKKLNYIF
jgi:predicted nuclease of predicted toxin-antitoxin system